MKTEVFRSDMSEAAQIILNGGLVAVPTETVYGLAGNGLNEEAVKNIYEVKGRPSVKPLSLMVSEQEAMERLCLDVPRQAHILAERYWPGPLTIVMKSREFIPPIVLAGGSTVGLRCPASELTLELIRKAGVPLAAPSANPSGKASPKSAEAVMGYFNGLIDGIIDGGECTLGVESTLIDVSSKPYRILRRGALSEAEITDTLVDGMTIIGITGQTGAGKTTALNVLRELGAEIIDCDSVYHDMLEQDTEFLSLLKEEFPTAFSGVKLNRKELGNIAFSSEEKLRKLNNLTHSHIIEKVRTLLRAYAMNGCSLAAVDAVELFSSGLSDMCSINVAVLSDEKNRVSRIMLRDSISEEYALKRVHAQKSEAYYIEHADFILENNSDETSFKNACKLKFMEVFPNG